MPLPAHSTALNYAERLQRSTLRLVSHTAAGHGVLADMAAQEVLGHALSLLVVLDAAGVTIDPNHHLAARLRSAAELLEGQRAMPAPDGEAQHAAG